jgi:hypothetical protein
MKANIDLSDKTSQQLATMLNKLPQMNFYFTPRRETVIELWKQFGDAQILKINTRNWPRWWIA